MGGSKENARKQLNNKPSQPPTTPSSAATGSAKKKRRKGKAIPSWSTFNAFKEQSKKIIALTPLVPRLTERQQMALLLKSNNATGTPAAQSVNPSADTTAEDYNHTHPTPSKPTRSAPYSTSGGGGAMEDPYGMAANIPLEEREVVFAPPSSAADLYRFFPAPAKKTELQSQTVDSFLTPRRSPEQRNSVGDDLSADESMPIDVKRNDDIENNDDDDDDVASWLDNNEKDGQVDENVENNNKNEEEEEEELIMEPGDNEIEDNPKLLDEKQPFSLGDLNHLKKTYNAAEKGEQKEVGEKFPVADEKSPESEPAKEKLFPSFISNADVAENDCIGDNNPTNSKSVITNSVVDPVDRPISTLTGAPFKMHRIRQQTTYRDEARKRFRSALDSALEQLDSRHNGRWNWCLSSAMMRKPLQDFYLSKEDYQWLAGGLFDFPRKFNFNREQFWTGSRQWCESVVQGLTSTLSLSPDAIQTINEMLRMHCERMLALLTEAQSDIQRLVNQFLFELDRFINGPHKCHPSTVRLLSGRQLRLYQLHFIGQQLRRLIEKWESHLVERLNAFKSESLAAHAALLIRWDQQLSGANLSLEWNFISRPTARRLLPSVRSDSIYYFGKQPLTDSLAASSLCRLPFGRVMEVEVDCRLLLAEAASSLDAQQTNANNRSSPKVLRVDLERVAAGPWDLIAFHQSLLQYPDLRRVV